MDAFRIALRRLVATLAIAGPILAGAPSDAAPPAEPPDADSDVHNLVLLAPAHPIFIQMRVQVDGQGLKSVRTAYAVKLFEQYDKDGDKLLDRNEAKAVPPLVKSASASGTVSIADRWEAVDINPADDKVSVEELAAYIDRVFGSTFLLSVRPRSAAQSVDLFPLLDLNHDGRLSRDELDAAPYSLHKLDLDDDETYTIDELQPFRNPQIDPQVSAVAANQATEQPFLLLDDAESIDRAAQELQRRYGDTGFNPRNASMKREALGVDEPSFATLDSDHDGTLNTEELKRWLRNPPPQVVIAGQFPQAKAGRPKLTIVDDQIGAIAKNAPGAAGKLPLSMKGIDIELKAATVRSRADASDYRSFRRQKFIEADRDKNKYISEDEFPALGLQNADFRTVDRDGDGMILMDELLAYVEQESASSQSRIELTISHDGKSVFEVIDANNDRRLSRRELAAAFSHLMKYDRDGDDAIAAVELAGRFQGTLELGRPVIFQRATAMNRGDTTAPMVSAPTSGPDWFRKMDRNRDGDLSPREFLGSPALFKKLDADGDGLISAAEAEQAAALGTATVR
jgi:Ca2+-binding EF-hand superfamily protein